MLTRAVQAPIVHPYSIGNVGTASESGAQVCPLRVGATACGRMPSGLRPLVRLALVAGQTEAVTSKKLESAGKPRHSGGRVSNDWDAARRWQTNKCGALP